MSDEPDPGTTESGVTGESPGTEPETESSSAEPASDDHGLPRPGRWSRVLPAWIRRRPLAAGIGAGILAAAVVAGSIVLIVRPWVPQPRYAALPEQPCALISAADVARYLPGAKGTPVSTGEISGVRDGVCKWSSTTGGEDRTLVAQAFVFRTASAVHQAQQTYRGDLSLYHCRCQGATVSAKPVAGLGDQAIEGFVVAGPTANFGQASLASSPGAILEVQSSNAVIGVYLDTTVTATGLSQTSPPSPAQLAGMVAMVRDMLAALADPASVPAPPAASLTAEPRYAGQPDVCRIASPETQARYMPGSTLTPLPGDGGPGGGAAHACGWGNNDVNGQINLTTYPAAASAWLRFQSDTGSLSQNYGQVRVTGMRWLNDLGESALASFREQDANASVVLIVRSGNAELYISYTDLTSSATSLTASATSQAETARLLAAATAMARDGLAALADPAAFASPRGPDYASPHNACQLVRTSTLTRYAPGADKGEVSGDDNQGGGQAGTSTCFWAAANGFLNMIVTTYSGVDYAVGSFQFGVAFTHHLATVKGMRPVHGLGDQATAVFETDSGSPEAELFVQSGNLLIDVSFTDEPDSPSLSQAGKLAADIAAARDVLTRLHHT